MRSTWLYIGLGVVVYAGALQFCKDVLFRRIIGEQQAIPWAFPASLLGVAASLVLLVLGIRIPRARGWPRDVRILAMSLGVLAVLLWGTWSWGVLTFGRIAKI